MRMIGSPTTEHSAVCYAAGAWIIKHGCVHFRIQSISLLNIDGNFRTIYLMEDDFDSCIFTLVYHYVHREVLRFEGDGSVYRNDILRNELSAVFAFVVDIDKADVLEAFIGDGDAHRLLRLPALAIFIEDLDIIRDKVLFSGLAGIVLGALL